MTSYGVKIKILVVYNPLSGRKRKKQVWYLLHKYLTPTNYHLDRLDLTKEDLADRLKHSEYDNLMVIGGDGSLRTVVDHLQQAKIKIPIILLPYGSANLIATSLKLPSSLKAIAEAIHNQRIVAIDIARLSSGQYFIGAFAIGYISDRVITTSQRVKQRLGFLGYMISFMMQTKLPLHTFDIVVDNKTYSYQGHSLFIVNTANVFRFKGRRRTSYYDGIFELVITTNRSFLSLCGLLCDFYFRRKKPKHFVLIPGREFSVYTSDKVSMQIDGEVLDEKHRAKIKVRPKQQEFIIP